MRQQLIEEYMADRIYALMGISVAPAKLYNAGEHKLSKFIDGKDLNTLDPESVDMDKVRQEIKDGFVLDCLLANWDVIGMGEDNIRLGDDGRVYRIDNGGSLHFRARGELKGDGFGEEVGELYTLRTAQAKWFGDIKEDEIVAQINDVLLKRAEIMQIIRDNSQGLGVYGVELTSTMNARLDYLRNWLIAKRKHEIESIGDKGEYGSIATNRYFVDWDNLDMAVEVGNIKDCMKSNITRIESNHESAYKGTAERLGISVEELKQAMQERVEDVVARSNFFKAIHLNLLEKALLVDERFKSQFESGSSNGCMNPSYRAEEEHKMFDFPNDPDHQPASRPIYGYFSDDPNGGQRGRWDKELFPATVNQYGNVYIKFKKDRVLGRTTITFADSLGSVDSYAPTPAAKPHFTSVYLPDDPLKQINSSSNVEWGGRYTEAQYHGGVTIEDIESIHISTKNRLDASDIDRVKLIFKKLKQKHPELDIKLVIF